MRLMHVVWIYIFVTPSRVPNNREKLFLFFSPLPGSLFLMQQHNFQLSYYDTIWVHHKYTLLLFTVATVDLPAKESYTKRKLFLCEGISIKSTPRKHKFGALLVAVAAAPYTYNNIIIIIYSTSTHRATITQPAPLPWAAPPRHHCHAMRVALIWCIHKSYTFYMTRSCNNSTLHSAGTIHDVSIMWSVVRRCCRCVEHPKKT